MIKKYHSVLLNSLDRIFDTVQSERTKFLKKYRLKQWDANVLCIMYAMGGDMQKLRPKDICTFLGSSSSYVSRALSNLLALGYIKNTYGTVDRRNRFVHITDKIDVNEILTFDEQLAERITRNLNEQEIAELCRLLDKCHEV